MHPSHVTRQGAPEILNGSLARGGSAPFRLARRHDIDMSGKKVAPGLARPNCDKQVGPITCRSGIATSAPAAWQYRPTQLTITSWPATVENATSLAKISSTVMAPLCPPNSPDVDTVTASRSFPCRIALRYRPKISKTASKQAKTAEFPCDDGARRIGCSNAAGGSKATICQTLWAFRKKRMS
jgi:hypothetical protein